MNVTLQTSGGFMRLVKVVGQTKEGTVRCHIDFPFLLLLLHHHLLLSLLFTGNFDVARVVPVAMHSLTFDSNGEIAFG